ncbi:MAG: hypothetical protein AAB524_03055 [Patescibacteria group bacterium]
MEKYFEGGRLVRDFILDSKKAIFAERNLAADDEFTQYRAYNGYDGEVDTFSNNLLYSIYYNGDYSKPYFDQILSTFRFVE